MPAGEARKDAPDARCRDQRTEGNRPVTGRRARRLHAALLEHWPRLFAYALALTQNREQAEDLLQDCAVRTLTTGSPPRGDRPLALWFFAVLRNGWIDQRRRQRIVAFEPLPDDAGLPVEYPGPAERLEDGVALREAFARLSPNHREIVALVDLAGFGYQEVAELLAIPPGTVMSRVSRARRALLKELEAPARERVKRMLAR